MFVLLYIDIQVSVYRNRNKGVLMDCFETENGLTYCANIEKLFRYFRYEHRSEEWRLFIDASKTSLKAVLLHNGNRQPSVPLVYSANLKESYASIELMLNRIEYDRYRWRIVADLKNVAYLMGLASGWPTFPCFLCLWNSRDSVNHYRKCDWPKRQEWRYSGGMGANAEQIQSSNHGGRVGFASAVRAPLVDRKKIIIPPLHVKIGLFQQFIKTVWKSGGGLIMELIARKTGACPNVTESGSAAAAAAAAAAATQENRMVQCALRCIRKLLPKKSLSLVVKGVFTGSEIDRILSDGDFRRCFASAMCYGRAVTAMHDVMHNFLGNRRADNYRQIVRNMVEAFVVIRVPMSLKIHFLCNHLDDFVSNLGDYSDQHGERFHQDIFTIENRYSGMSHASMLSDHCWFLIRESSGYDTMWKRKANKNYFQ